MAESDVKYLSFVQRGAESLYYFAENSYTAVKKKTFDVSPKVVQDAVFGAEATLKPVVGKCVGIYGSMLQWADSLVGAGMNLGTDAMASVQSRSKSAVEGFQLRFQKTWENDVVADVKSTAQAKYSSVHDAIISNPRYAQVYQTVVAYTKWTVNQPYVKGPTEMVFNAAYPRFKNVVDPVVTTVEPYFKAIEEHLEPRAGTSPMALSEASTKSEESS